ncbi:MAG: hypothetical protein J0M00_07015 [Burkholderiales bacterium]|nr:hypothetical protein [Burkholderiales bacterium]
MKMRRYREGRLVRMRQLRRATLESERDLVLQRLDGIFRSLDRFSLMLAALRIVGTQAAAAAAMRGPGEGFSAARDAAEAEPEMQDGVAGAGDPPPGRRC